MVVLKEIYRGAASSWLILDTAQQARRVEARNFEAQEESEKNRIEFKFTKINKYMLYCTRIDMK